MTKEEFSAILNRQQNSGLSIKNFCENEVYTVSSFHYWKSKFGLTRPYRDKSSAEMGFVPIHLSSGTNHSSDQISKTNQIEVEFPNGIKIRLNNFNDLQTAGMILTQALRSHVLSE